MFAKGEICIWALSLTFWGHENCIGIRKDKDICISITFAFIIVFPLFNDSVRESQLKVSSFWFQRFGSGIEILKYHPFVSLWFCLRIEILKSHRFVFSWFHLGIEISKYLFFLFFHDSVWWLRSWNIVFCFHDFVWGLRSWSNVFLFLHNYVRGLRALSINFCFFMTSFGDWDLEVYSFLFFQWFSSRVLTRNLISFCFFNDSVQEYRLWISFLFV